MTSESWRYQQRRHGQPARDYAAEIIYLDGEHGQRMARDLAAVTAELLTWARDQMTASSTDLDADHHHHHDHHDLGEAA